MNKNEPLVTVLTPVYNGAKYLAECIESVLAQTHKNFEYVIANNCSTDGTLDIAKAYAKQDRRIRIHCNDTFVNCEENHNAAFTLISQQSKYCKVVSADDWIAPDCLSKMVYVMEEHATVGIVGCYQKSGERILWKGIPVDASCSSGREICRLTFLENWDVLGCPTSLMYRSNLIRNNSPFFPHLRPHADTSACYKYLQNTDFGFVHEILSYERVHADQESSEVRRIGAANIATLDTLLTYGPLYLNSLEFEARKGEAFSRYYRWLGGSALKMHGPQFWKYHTAMLCELGYPIQWQRVIGAAINEIVTELRFPTVALNKLIGAVTGKNEIRIKEKSEGQNV